MDIFLYINRLPHIASSSVFFCNNGMHIATLVVLINIVHSKFILALGKRRVDFFVLLQLYYLAFEGT
jgi:hypothetical protein